MAFLSPVQVDSVQMAFHRTLRLEATRTFLTGLGIYERARVGLDFEMLTLDVCLQSFRLPEVLNAWGVFRAVELRVVNVLVSLQSAIGGEALSASSPLAGVCSLNHRVAMSILQMSLQVVLARKCLITARLGAGERAFFVVASHVGLEATWTVETLSTASNRANIIPLTASLAICPPRTIVGVVDLVIAGIVRREVVLVERLLRGTCREC